MDERSERLSLGTLLAYGVPAVGFAFPLFLVQLYFLKFATDVLLIAPGIVGLLVGLGRVWDAISDPLAGYWSDRTRTPLGRRRPWMLAGIPMLLGAFTMLWSPPASFHGTALVVWSAAGLLLIYTAFTVYAVPHTSLGAELSLDYHERSRVFATRHVALQIGVATSFGAVYLLENTASPRQAAGDLARFAGPVCAAALLLTPLLLRERPDYVGRGSRSPFSAARDVLGNPHARVLLFVYFIEALGGGVLGVLAPFFADYVLQRPQAVIVIPAFFFLFSVGSIPVWVRLSRRFGKHRVWRVAMFGTALSFGATLFAGQGDVALLSVLMALAGISSGCGGAVGQSILADVIDVDELRTGERKEGSYAATWGFAQKFGVGAVVVLSGFALQLSGFEPNVEQPPSALLVLRLLFAVPPLTAYLVGGAIFWRYFRMDEAEHARVRAALDARNAGD